MNNQSDIDDDVYFFENIFQKILYFLHNHLLMDIYPSMNRKSSIIMIYDNHIPDDKDTDKRMNNHPSIPLINL
ncbi:hypothetical protein DERP_001309 [Dermatophagoides pteronyssinus]|uniref:Plasmodium falciparum erythrocyte membrane protein 1 acidic terminal segment domain-containing protein n=1 Tax=Dermatophagoides pteronyssinus TaxID=6956 RepID=A0ABQ8JE47_DERPT|nr:hypothetical protein DERP_001309 [Dermatophagoides pteronyssinus]